MAFASIDIPAMTKLISAIDSASSQLLWGPNAYSQIMSPVNVDPSPANKLSQASFWIADVEPGLKRRLALAQADEASGGGFQKVVRIDESMLSTVDPITAQNNGATVAKELKDANGKVSPQLLAQLAKNQNDPYFAAGLGKNLTPAQLAQIVQDSSNTLRYSGNQGDTNSSDYKNYKSLMVAMGTTLGTATRNTNDLAMPPDTAKQWSSLMTAEPGDKGYKSNQAAALSVLLRHGDYATPFLNTVSTTVYNYERSKNGDPTWGPKADDTNPIFNPDAQGVATDVMANTLAGLGHNPDAAQKFFDVGNPNASTTSVTIDGHKVQLNARLKYLISDRTWSSSVGSDEGAGLGSALRAATTFYRNDGSTGQISATIASQTLNLVGSKAYSGKNDGHWYLAEQDANEGWQPYTGMRGPLADILASYAPDLMRTGSDPNHKDNLSDGWLHYPGQDNLPPPAPQNWPPGGPAGVNIDRTALESLLHSEGQDPHDMDVIGAGVARAGNLRLQYALQQATTDGNKSGHDAAADLIGNTTIPGIDGAIGDTSKTLGFVMNNGFSGDDDKQKDDKAKAEALSKAFSIVAAAPTLAVPESAPWTGYLVDQAKDIAADQIGDGGDQDAQSVYNAKSTTSENGLKQSMLNTLAANGYFSPKAFSDANKKYGQYYTPPPDSAFKLGSDGKPLEPRQFDFSSQGYSVWSSSGNGLPRVINDDLVGPFHDQFPSLGTDGGS